MTEVKSKSNIEINTTSKKNTSFHHYHHPHHTIFTQKKQKHKEYFVKRTFILFTFMLTTKKRNIHEEMSQFHTN